MFPARRRTKQNPNTPLLSKSGPSSRKDGHVGGSLPRIKTATVTVLTSLHTSIEVHHVQYNMFPEGGAVSSLVVLPRSLMEQQKVLLVSLTFALTLQEVLI